MSTNEYNDLFIKAQKDGPYHMFVFDMINSRSYDKEARQVAMEKTESLMMHIYDHLQILEMSSNKKILVFEEGFSHYWDNKYLNDFGLKIEPFIFGDSFGFTILRDSLSEEEVYNIFNYYHDRLNIDIPYHFANGYYETNDYAKGDILYHRSYCLDTLSNYHKKYEDNYTKS